MAPPKGFKLTVEQRAKIADANRRHWTRPEYREQLVSKILGRANNKPSGRTLRDRLDFYSMPEPNSGCLLWLGPVDGNGYGLISWRGRTLRAHRAAWEDANGPLPDGFQACHHCDNPGCIELRHLFPGTNADNTADKMRKGRHRSDPPLGENQGHSKLTDTAVLSIRADGRSNRALAGLYGVAPSTISRVRSRQAWGHL